jgi:hypothetical protein
MGEGLMMRGLLNPQPLIEKVPSITWVLNILLKNHPEGWLNLHAGF